MPTKSYSERRAILVAIATIGRTASLVEIENALPSDRAFAKKRTALRQMLDLMAREGLVMRVPTGAYLARVGCDGLGSDHLIVRSIVACLHECGGVMRLGDILRDFVDCRIWGRDERDEQSLRILRIIAHSDCFWQDGEIVGLVSERPSRLGAPSVSHSPTAPGQVSHGG